MSMEPESGEHTSQLFLVRLWADAADDTGARSGSNREWHGKVQNVMTGKAASFDDWPTLVDLLMGMMPPATLNGNRDEKP